jgi:hypothetical protein
MRPGYLWLLSFCSLPLAGWPLLAHKGYRQISFICRASLAAATGAVLTSFWMTAAALLGIAWRPLWLFLLAVLTAFFLRLTLRREERVAESSAGNLSRRVPEKISALLLGGSLAVAFVSVASAAATSIDLLLFWGPKAQAFAAVRTIDAGFLSDPSLHYLHVSYPPLVTNLYAFATMVAGRFPWGAATLTFPLLLAMLALALPGILRSVAPAGTAWAASALIIAAFGFLGNDLDVAGNAEPFLWLFETLSMAVFLGAWGSTRSGQLLAGLLLAGAATAKVEGLVFIFAALVLFLLFRRDARSFSAAALLMLPTVFSLGCWFAFGAAHHSFIGYEGYGRLTEVRWERLPIVLAAIGKEFWVHGFALPFLLPLLALLIPLGRPRLAFLPLGTAFSLSAFFVFTYLHGETDPTEWIGWSAIRIFSPVLALLALSSICAALRGEARRPSLKED